MNSLMETLERVTRVAGIRGAMLVSESDGLVVAEALAEGLEGAAVAALAASLTLRLRRTAQTAGLAVPAVVQLKAETGTLITVPAGDDLLLVAVAIATTTRPYKAHTFITFAGDAGGMVLGALLVATFYVPPGHRLHTSWLRWGFLVIMALVFFMPEVVQTLMTPVTYLRGAADWLIFRWI